MMLQQTGCRRIGMVHIAALCASALLAVVCLSGRGHPSVLEVSKLSDDPIDIRSSVSAMQDGVNGKTSKPSSQTPRADTDRRAVFPAAWAARFAADLQRATDAQVRKIMSSAQRQGTNAQNRAPNAAHRQVVRVSAAKTRGATKSTSEERQDKIRRSLPDSAQHQHSNRAAKQSSLAFKKYKTVLQPQQEPPGEDHRDDVDDVTEAANHHHFKKMHNGNVVEDTVEPSWASDWYERPTKYYDRKGFQRDYKHPYNPPRQAAAEAQAFRIQHPRRFGSRSSGGGFGSRSSGGGFGSSSSGGGFGSSSGGGFGSSSGGGFGSSSGGGFGSRSPRGGYRGPSYSPYDPVTGRYRGQYNPQTHRYQYQRGNYTSVIPQRHMQDRKYHRHVQDPWLDPAGLFSRNPAHSFPYFYAEGRHWDPYSYEAPHYDWDQVLSHGKMLKKGLMSHGRDKTWADLPDAQWGWEHQFANWDPEGVDNDALMFGALASEMGRKPEEVDEKEEAKKEEEDTEEDEKAAAVAGLEPAEEEKKADDESADEDEDEEEDDVKALVGRNPWELTWIAGPDLEGDTFVPGSDLEPRFTKPVINEFGNLGEATEKNQNLVFGHNHGLLRQRTARPIDQNWNALQDSMVPPGKVRHMLDQRGWGPSPQVTKAQKYGNMLHPFSDFWDGWDG